MMRKFWFTRLILNFVDSQVRNSAKGVNEYTIFDRPTSPMLTVIYYFCSRWKKSELRLELLTS
jgi:hypothetical protein